MKTDKSTKSDLHYRRNQAKTLVARFPLPSALLTVLMAMLCLIGPLWIPGLDWVAQLVCGRVAICLFAILVLTFLGWWRETGFVRPAGWHILRPYLPLALLMFAVKAFDTAALGIHFGELQMILVGLFVYLAGGFMEEAIFRGLLLRILLPGGLIRGATLSALFFALAHLLNLAAGANLAATLLQVGVTFLAGFVFTAPLAITRNIWPLVVIHGLGNFVGYLNAGGFLDTAATSQAPTAIDIVLSVVPYLLLAAYSVWLLRRAGRRARPERSGRSSPRPLQVNASATK